MSRIILVTGGNSGIGYELVQLLAVKGHTVYIGARNPASGKKAQEKVSSAGLETVKFVQLDVTSQPSIKAAVETIASAEGKLDVLVNNAGISEMDKPQNATNIDTAIIRETMETNFFGLIQTTIAFLPLLRKSTTGAPVILNLSSDLASNTWQARAEAAEAGLPSVVAYKTSRVAANSYTIALSHELKNEGFKVNAVSPGLTSTKLSGYMQGGKSVQDGAKSLLDWALLDKDGKTGAFIGEHGEEFPW